MRTFLSTFLALIWISNFTWAGHFECGENGRFEYCIDKSEMSCVVGCHCHPGYYFDTDSKVCEPSSKLTQTRRIHYEQLIPTTTKRNHLTFPTPTTTDIIDQRVDAIAQDAGDLGDWLYNQFFKTIENQVINNTANDGFTRRGGNDSGLRNSKQKKAKKVSNGRKHLRRKGSKKKHLRIPENDSLFDDSSESSETDSDSSDTSSNESDPSDSFRESDHGHRKIIMINKKPKPPLPSFIFLPNLETSFYPPIGLPPPPAIPMFPMVPVPPMLQYPLPVTNCSTQMPSSTDQLMPSSINQPMPTSNIVPTDSANNIPTEQTPNSITTNPTVPTDKTPDVNPTGQSTIPSSEPTTVNEPLLRSKRKKLLQQIQDMMHAKRGPKPEDDLMNFLNPAPEPDIFGETSVLDSPMDMGNNAIKPEPPANVNFKYLTQLIHRKKLNKINKLIPGAKPERIQRIKKPRDSVSNVEHNRRMYQQTSNLNESDETFYASLGRQIASLIRNINNDNKVDMTQTTAPPLLNWDRYARSLFKIKRIKNIVNNENDNLLLLENRIQDFATTPAVLSLHELENIISMMETAKSQMLQNKHDKYNARATPNKSYNVKLLPKMRRENIYNAVTNKNEIIRTNKQNKSKNTIIINPKILPTNNNNYNRAKYTQGEIIASPKSVPILSMLPNKINISNQEARYPRIESIIADNPIVVSTPPALRFLPLNIPLNRMKTRNYFTPYIQSNYNNNKAVPLMNPRFLQQIRPSFMQPVYNQNSFFQPETQIDVFTK